MPIVGGGRVSPISGVAISPSNRKRKKLSLNTEDEIYDFVQEAHTHVMKLWDDKQKLLLQQHLKESLDPFVRDDTTVGQSPAPRLYPRLLANEDVAADILQTLYCRPCSNYDETTACNNNVPTVNTAATTATTTAISNNDDDDNASSEDDLTSDDDDDDQPITTKKMKKKIAAASFSVKLRGDKQKLVSHSIGPPRYLPSSDRLPASSATIFLKTHYAAEDEQNLKYVPYFGDDDKDDVVSDLYNLEDRQNQMEFGAEYEERNTNELLDQILLLVDERLRDGNVESSPTTEIHEALATIMDEYLDRIHQRYDLVILKKTPPPASAASATQNTGITVQPASSQVLSKKPVKKRLESYLDAMDTYRPLFCRRCFIYDCNMHSNLQKPSLQLQGELAIQRERDGFWNELEGHLGGTGTSTVNEGKKRSVASSKSDSGDDMEDDEDKKPTAATIANSDDSSNKESSDDEQDKAKKPAALELITRGNDDKKQVSSSTADNLTPLQKVICERMFLIFQGDIQNMATTIGAPESAVAEFCRLKEYKLETEFKILKKEHVRMFQNKKRKKKNVVQSMNNYNPTWLKRVDASEIHPFFVPCDHELPCSESTCSCVQNAFFCTKHCAWERRSRNFFRGCACNGRCTTKACSCFAAKRECDPDLCKQCGACTDPPHAPPTTRQRCRNDNIGMRRHTHMLLAKSQIEDAGWGIYNRHALKKGDYIHEYVGEVISQEEAERRGRVYDKVNRSYLFNLSSDCVVDASRKGNKTRFANHSNKPNSYARMVDVNGDIHIGLFAKEDIEPQTEIFFDYRYDVGMDNDLIIKPGMTVDWMKNPKMANKISKKYAPNMEGGQAPAATEKE